jgi:uncharacterized protein involved in exopolysaccharide biosynthesis
MTEVQNSSSSDDEVDLRSVARRVWKSRWIVAAASCLAPIVVLFIIWNMPGAYESTATVIVTAHPLVGPINAATQLVPGPLSMEGYQQEAQSEAVLNVLQRKIQTMGIPPSSVTRPGALTVIGYSAVPSIGLTAVAADSSNAQAIANAWAAAFIEVDVISAKGRRQKGIEVILSSYKKALSDVSRIEGELRAVEDRHLQAHAHAEFSVNESQKAAELASRVQRTLAIEDELGRTKASLEDAKERIAQLERELKDASGFSSVVEKMSLERSSLRGLLAREAVLQAQLSDGRAEVDRLRREVSDAKLTLAKLSTQQVREIASLNRAAMEARLVYENLSQKYPEVIAARDAPVSYLKMGPPAPLPQAPRSPTYARAWLALPFALFVSLACALFAAVVLESKTRRHSHVHLSSL